MFFLIFSLVFLFFALIAFLIGALKGRKYVWQLSVSRIIVVIISAALTALICSGLANLTASLVAPLIGSIPGLSDLGGLELGIDLPLANMITVLAVMLLMPLLFVPIFWIVRPIIKLFLKLMTKGLVKITSRPKKTADESAEEDSEQPKKRRRPRKYDEFRLSKYSWVGALCGGLCGFMTLCVMAMPVVGTASKINEVAAPAFEHIELEGTTKQVAEIIDASANNAGAVAVKLMGGGLLYDASSSVEIDGTTSDTVTEDLTTVAEIVAVAVQYDVANSVTSDPMALLSNEPCMTEFLALILENPRLNPLIDSVSDMALSTLMDSIGVPAHKAPLYDAFLYDMQNPQGASLEMLTKSYTDIFDHYGLRVAKELPAQAAEAKLSGADMTLWTATNVVADLDAFCAKSELVVIDDIVNENNEIKDPKHEAAALAHAFATLTSLVDGDIDMSDTKSVMNKLGPALDSLAATETIGAVKTEHILMGMLQSDQVHGSIGLSVLGATDTAVSIYEGTQTSNYASMLTSLGKAVDVVQAAADSSKDTNESVKELLNDLTPETSKVLQTVTTPEVVVNHGVPEKSAEPVSDMLSSTFENLSNAKEEGMTDEEYEKESKAVSNMMDILMSSTEKEGDTVFGENSVTGITAEEYINNIMESKVMSETLVDKVYGDGDEPTIDPLNSERGLAEEEKADLVDALNNKWLASDKSDETKKEITALASVLNVTVSVTDEGVSEVVA